MCDHILKRPILYLWLHRFKGFTMMRADEAGLLCHITFVGGGELICTGMQCATSLCSLSVCVSGLVFCFYTCQVKLAASPRNCHAEKKTTGEE